MFVASILVFFLCSCDFLFKSPQGIKEKEYSQAERKWRILKEQFPLPSNSKELQLSLLFPSESDIKSGVYFRAPKHLDFDRDGNIYVSDSYLNFVFEFDPKGSFIGKLGGMGQGPGEFNNPVFISFNKENHLFVEETGNLRIQVFDPQHDLINSFKIYKPYSCMTLSEDGNIVLSYLSPNPFEPLIEVLNLEGAIISSFGKRIKFSPYYFALNEIDISVNKIGEFFVAWINFPRVHRFSANGDLLSDIKIEYDLLHELAKPNFVTKTVKEKKTLMPVIRAIDVKEVYFYLLMSFPRLEILKFDLDGALIDVFWKNTAMNAHFSDFLVSKNEGKEIFYILQEYPEQLVKCYLIE